MSTFLSIFPRIGTAFGDDDQFVTDALYRFSDYFLGTVVAYGRVDRVDALVDGLRDHVARVLWSEHPPSTVRIRIATRP
jgi:hypothetical protein